MLISICVTTYNRPNGLKRLLTALAKLAFKKVETPDIEVIIVDNDSRGLAVKIAEEFQLNFPWTLKIDVEPQQGVTYGRNKSLSLASPQTNAIAIIDDDEVPIPNWLDELLWIQQEYNADIVTGPVEPRFEEGKAPSWILKGGFFSPPRYKTGESRDVAFTNNVLIRAEILQPYNPVFDNRFAFTGGEDAHLFMRLYRAGYKIIWADEAIVYDWIPEERTKSKWVLERYRHMWSIHSLVEKELDPSWKIKLMRIVKGLALIIIGIFRLPSTLIFGRQGLFSSLIYIYKGMGTFVGLLELNRQEYKNS